MYLSDVKRVMKSNFSTMMIVEKLLFVTLFRDQRKIIEENCLR